MDAGWRLLRPLPLVHEIAVGHVGEDVDDAGLDDGFVALLAIHGEPSCPLLTLLLPTATRFARKFWDPCNQARLNRYEGL